MMHWHIAQSSSTIPESANNLERLATSMKGIVDILLDLMNGK